MVENLCLCPEDCDKTITVLISSTKADHPGYMKENAALTFPTQKRPFQINRISQNPHYRSRQLALAFTVLQSVKITFELFWIENLLVFGEGFGHFCLPSFLPIVRVSMKVTNPVLVTGSPFCS